jgi:HAMP domain-containing protein
LPWKRWILWGVLIVGALLLLAMAWRLARTGE